MSLELESPAETYTAAEILEAVKTLTAQHKIALVKLARAYAMKTSFGHEDLLHEAYMRVLDGRREWPRTVAVVPFLAGVMRSIAWDWQAEPRNGSGEVVDDIGYEDQTAAARIDIRKMVALFDDDLVAQKMVIALLDGARGEELRELSGLTKTEYESKRAKIRRRIEKVWF